MIGRAVMRGWPRGKHERGKEGSAVRGLLLAAGLIAPLVSATVATLGLRAEHVWQQRGPLAALTVFAILFTAIQSGCLVVIAHRHSGRTRGNRVDSERRLRALLESAPDAMVVVDRRGIIEFVNEQSEHLFGYVRGELIGQRVEMLLPPRLGEAHVRHRLAYNAAPKARSMGSSMALVAVHKDGTEIPVEVSLSPVETEAGMLVSSAIRDVSERRRNEARVLSAAIVESSDDAIYSCDVDGLIEIWNASATRLFGYAADEVVGTRAETIIPLGRRLEMSVLFARALEGVAVEQYETERKRKDGADVEVSLSLSPMCDAEERVVGVSVIARDITRAKEAERRLVASLREKEVLLKEVHHRVKNNLQIISSLLNMHGSRTSESQSTFQEMQDRIRAIALFHEKLYRSSDVSFIDFAEYLRELASSVVLQHGTPERVGVRVDAESLNLGVDVAIPCGLIANELITNALKYAFIDSSDLGHHNVDVTFRSRDGMSEFVVRDDGRGLPTGFDILAAETLGLQLVRALVEQIHGTFELDSSQSQGTCVRIRFATHPGGSG